MGRVYDTLECGCLISCDGGGGLIPCDFIDDNPNCKASEYIEEHKCCDVCGDCIVCFDHGDCSYKVDDFVMDVEMFLENIIEESQELLNKLERHMKK